MRLNKIPWKFLIFKGKKNPLKISGFSLVFPGSKHLVFLQIIPRLVIKNTPSRVAMKIRFKLPRSSKETTLIDVTFNVSCPAFRHVLQIAMRNNNITTVKTSKKNRLIACSVLQQVTEYSHFQHDESTAAPSRINVFR